jgi:hypothetical protein
METKGVRTVAAGTALMTMLALGSAVANGDPSPTPPSPSPTWAPSARDIAYQNALQKIGVAVSPGLALSMGLHICIESRQGRPFDQIAQDFSRNGVPVGANGVQVVTLGKQMYCP